MRLWNAWVGKLERAWTYSAMNHAIRNSSSCRTCKARSFHVGTKLMLDWCNWLRIKAIRLMMTNLFRFTSWNTETISCLTLANLRLKDLSGQDLVSRRTIRD